MDQLIEFAANHPMLSSGFVLVLLALVWTEISRRTQGFSELTPAQAVPLINRADTVILDVSASAEYGKGHIVGARHVPPSRLDKP
ncbi:MAG: rhodanese-like domain-containing protein, partial [Gammaproteobacteria bacterium]|nr:rhodanese-like domain-containing protein [Gammaproteobacteria bacterium]